MAATDPFVHRPTGTTSLRNARSRVIRALNEAGVAPAGRQLVLNEVAELEHRLHEEATRADGLAELLEGMHHVLRDDPTAEAAARALRMLERESAIGV